MFKVRIGMRRRRDGMGWDGTGRDGNVAIIKRQTEQARAPSRRDGTGWNRTETTPFFWHLLYTYKNLAIRTKLQGLAVS